VGYLYPRKVVIRHLSKRERRLLEPFVENLSILNRGFLGLALKPGTNALKAERIAELLNDVREGPGQRKAVVVVCAVLSETDAKRCQILSDRHIQQPVERYDRAHIWTRCIAAYDIELADIAYGSLLGVLGAARPF
jgi:hypothetical protein